MKKQLGIKTSSMLLICRIVVVLLFVGGVSCLFLARQEKFTEELSNLKHMEQSVNLASNSEDQQLKYLILAT